MWFIGVLWEYVAQRIWACSGLTSYDHVSLAASFYYYWDDRLNCRRAIEVASTRTTGGQQALQIIKSRFGCDTIADTPRITIDGIGFHSCLCNYLHPLFFTYLDLVGKLEHGILPHPGAYLDQPAQTVEAMQHLARMRADVQAAEAAKEKAKPNGRREQR